MKHDPSHDKKSFNAEDYPALADFFPAYLHQDFGEEYSSAAGAAKGFVEDASGDEILQVKEEWNAFRNAMKGTSLQETQTALGKLGSAWQPQDETELKELDSVFREAKA